MNFDDAERAIKTAAQEREHPDKSGCGTFPGRLSVRILLEQRIKECLATARNLQALYDALPLVIPREADDALSELIVRFR